jgi:hypothetical protein
MISGMWNDFFRVFIDGDLLDKSYKINEWFTIDFDLILLFFSIMTLHYLIILPFLKLLRKWNGTSK